MDRIQSINKTLNIFAKNFDEAGRVIIGAIEFHDVIKKAFLMGLADGFTRAEDRASGDNYLVLTPLDEHDKELSWICFLKDMKEERCQKEEE